MLQNEQPIDPRWAWERYRPSAESPWDLKKAGHLYRRAALGASWDDLQAAVRDGPDRAIGFLERPHTNAQRGLEDLDEAPRSDPLLTSRGAGATKRAGPTTGVEITMKDDAHGGPGQSR